MEAGTGATHWKDQLLGNTLVRFGIQKNGLVLYPRNSMTQNIGNDGSGTHTAAESTYQVTLADHPVHFFPTEIAENVQGYEAIKYFYAHRKGSLFNRGIRFLKKKINKFNK
ncbi:hypothetical protein KUH03_20800 [Sphingobacterium sp. E70]|uniref:hypothetical protein n=1 Tax=Sphingobacterium sp. E70 TaxID=2853439 RepID=UPI00211CF774|nr:hypothetical protein [Sphingobacterium sp. E70]ULT28699.1 hypothetical protein KUH03_20800 [Sphingobacterium sp. E70]